MFLSKCAAKPLIYDMPIIGTLQLIILRIYNILLYPDLPLSPSLPVSPARMWGCARAQGLRIWFLPWHASTQPGLGFSVIDRVCIVESWKTFHFHVPPASINRIYEWINEYRMWCVMLCCMCSFYVWVDGSGKTILNFPFASNEPNRTESRFR